MCESADQDVSLTCFDNSEHLLERNFQNALDNYDKTLNLEDKQPPHLKITNCNGHGRGSRVVSASDARR